MSGWSAVASAYPDLAEYPPTPCARATDAGAAERDDSSVYYAVIGIVVM